MLQKSNKLDIGSVKRKIIPFKPTHAIKREVFDTNFLRPKRARASAYAETTPIPQYAANQTKPAFSRSILGFAAAGVLLAVLFNSTLYLSSAQHASGEILGLSTSAYAELGAAGKNLSSQEYSSAQSRFTAAQNSLMLAQNRLDTYRALKLIAGKAQSADSVLRGAYMLAEAGKKLASAAMLFEELSVSSKGIEASGFQQKLAGHQTIITETLDLLINADRSFAKANDLPPEYQHELIEARKQAQSLISILTELQNLEDLYLLLFGPEPKTYLLLFQNYDELRATGGFVGTYGVLKQQQGKIKKLKIESVYNLDGQITDQIAAPGPFHPNIKKWSMRDANWFVDFRQSAAKLLDFFEKGGETADGVIAFTPKLFEELLALTGPITMPAYDTVLTAENFQDMVQYKTSYDFDRKLNQPKKFLDDFAPVLLNRLSELNKEQWLMLLQSLQDSLAEKNILIYSKNSNVQAKIESIKAGGVISSAPHDYLSFVSSNLGGTKTDLEINNNLNLTSRILSDGAIINTLTIERSNSAASPNRSYLRVLVPQGSVLVAATGFDAAEHGKSSALGFKTDPDLAVWDRGHLAFKQIFIRTEAGKTEFSGFSHLEADSSKTMTLVYSLPIKIETSMFKQTSQHSLLLQRQPGMKNFTFSANIDLGRFSAAWLGEGITNSGNSLLLEYNKPSDQYWPALLSK